MQNKQPKKKKKVVRLTSQELKQNNLEYNYNKK